MKKLLLIALLIVGCASKQTTTPINTLDGKISINSTTLNTDDVKEECKVECEKYVVSKEEWCDCMYQCSKDVINKISIINLNMRIYLEECSSDPQKN